jgi:hypothetical protein
MSPILNLSDEGYRKVCQLPGWGNVGAEKVAETMAQVADYEASGSWVRRRARKKTGRVVDGIELVDLIEPTTDLRTAELPWIDDYFHYSEFTKTGVPDLTATNEDLLRLVQDAAASEQRWRAMRQAAAVLAMARHQRLRPLFREHIAPLFFRLYPAGKIIIVRYHAENDNAAAITRCQYAAAQTPLQQVTKGVLPGVSTLQNWHLNSIASLGPLLIELFGYLFYPFVGGYRAGLPGLDFLFLFEPAEQYSPPPFPRDWLAIPSTTAGFSKQRINVFESIKQFESKGPAWQDAGHQRFRYDHGYDAGQRLELLRWYISRCNRLLYELSDIANFTEGHAPDAAIDPIFAFEHFLTVDRLMRDTALCMSVVEPGMAHHLTFEVADLYDTLSERFKNHADKTDFFKRLFDTQVGPTILRPRLANLPDPFGPDLAALTEQLYKTIEEKIVASVWVKSKVQPGGVLVRDKELKNEELIPRSDFVGELMRVYRNAHHGYFTSGDPRQQRPSRYLFLVDGDLPVEMTALPALWWLAYLADPTMVGWRHLPVGLYH